MTTDVAASFERYPGEFCTPYTLRYLREKKKATRKQILRATNIRADHLSSILSKLAQKKEITASWKKVGGVQVKLYVAAAVDSTPRLAPAPRRTPKAVTTAIGQRGDCPLAWFPAPVPRAQGAHHGAD